MFGRKRGDLLALKYPFFRKGRTLGRTFGRTFYSEEKRNVSIGRTFGRTKLTQSYKIASTKLPLYGVFDTFFRGLQGGKYFQQILFTPTNFIISICLLVICMFLGENHPYTGLSGIRNSRTVGSRCKFFNF